MTRHGEAALIDSLRRHSESAVRAHTREVQFGIVTVLGDGASDFTVEVSAAGLVLDEDDLVWDVLHRGFDQGHGIAVGDTLVLVPNGEGDYAVLGLITGNDPPATAEGVMAVPASASTVTISLPFEQPDAAYGVLLTPSWSTAVWFSGRTTSQVVANFGTTNGAAQTVAWRVVR